MVKVYTIGHSIPQKIKEVIEEWDYWMYIVVASQVEKNKDAKMIIEKLEDDMDKILNYRTKDGLDVFVSYMFSQK